MAAEEAALRSAAFGLSFSLLSRDQPLSKRQLEPFSDHVRRLPTLPMPLGETSSSDGGWKASGPSPVELNDFLFGTSSPGTRRTLVEGRAGGGAGGLLGSRGSKDRSIAEMWSSKLTWLPPSAHRNTVAAASGSFVSTIAGFPLDSVKSRLQVKR